MPSMVNANRFIRMGAIPLVIAAYAVFLWTDHNGNNDPDIKDYVRNIEKNGGVDGLVFGGSNAVFSLSAEFISYYSGLKWYNASVMLEMGRINRYRDFIEDLAARIDRTKVRYVVYSSELPYSIGSIAAYTSEKESIRGLRIKPKKSILEYILKPPEVPQRNSFGDIVFDSVKCVLTHGVRHEREYEDISVNFLVDQAIFFASVFPSASILIVLPSEYYGGAMFDDQIFEQALRRKFYSVLGQKYHLKDNMVKIIFQPPYFSITHVCDYQMHANEKGRLWRTQNLVESMHSVYIEAGYR